MKLSLLSLFLLQTTQGAQILRHRRDAEPLFGGIVNNILGIFTGGQDNQPASPPSYHRPAPSYRRPAPSYKKPAPTYHAPAPTYHAPAPTHHAHAPVHHAPAPVHHAPAPVYHAPAHHAHAPAPATYDPPAPKPEIHILPAPDLSQYAPTVDSYGSPVATTYEEPAPAVDSYGSPDPVIVVDSYGSPEPVQVIDSYGSPDPAPAVDSYGSPVAPTYVEPAPVSVYTEPIPVYEQPAPAPAYEAPTETPIITYVEPAPIPTYVEPAPAPTYVEPVPIPTYVEPAPITTYVETAPISTYADPAPAPTYVEPAPIPTYVDPAPVTTYVEPVPVEPVPTYEAAPVYEPTNYEPAPVDISTLGRAQPVPEAVAPEISEVVTLKEADEPEEIVQLVDLRQVEERDPKALSFGPAQVNTIQPITIKSEDDVIIDLTRENDNFITVTEASLVETEIIDEAQPVAITFEQSPIQSLDQPSDLLPVELPATPHHFDTSIPTTQSIILDQTSPVVTVDTTVVDVVDSVQTEEPVQVISFHTIDQDNVLDTFHTVEDVTTVLPVDLPVTPIVASEELRSLVQPQEEIIILADEDNNEVEVFDLVSGDQQNEDLTIVELSDPEITKTLAQEAELVEEELVEEFGEEAVLNLEKDLVNEVEEELIQEVEEEITKTLAQEAKLVEEELVEEFGEEAVLNLEKDLVNEVEEELVQEVENEIVEQIEEDAVSLLEEETIKELEEVVEKLESVVEDQSEVSTPAPQPETTKGPTFRKVTFKILGPDETTPEPSSFRLVDPEDAAVDTFTVNDDAVIPDAPGSLNSDPAFVEIAADASPQDQRKRGLRNYDPRKRVYGHKYNDQFSNWYYYSRNGY